MTSQVVANGLTSDRLVPFIHHDRGLRVLAATPEQIAEVRAEFAKRAEAEEEERRKLARAKRQREDREREVALYGIELGDED
jgi:hypothetical protein